MGQELQIHILQSESEIERAFPLMHELRDRIRAGTFLQEVRRQQNEGYVLAGGFADGQTPVCLAGFRIASTLARGPHLFVDDLVTSSQNRGRGYGTQMLRWLAAYAKERQIQRIYLDSRDTAAGFYGQVGFTFLTSIPCWIDPQRLLQS